MKQILIVVTLFTALFSNASCAERFPTSHYFDDDLVVELADAALAGDAEGIKAALNKGADVNYKGIDDLTILHWLMVARKSTEKNKAGFRILLENGADPHLLEARLSMSVLMLASQYEHPDYLKILMEAGVDPNYIYASAPSYPTALFYAARTFRFENMEILLSNGADTEIEAELGWTVLLRTAGNWRGTYILLQHGADYTVEYPVVGGTIVSVLKNIRYWPPKDGIDWREKVIEFLRERGVEVNPWMPPEEER